VIAVACALALAALSSQAGQAEPPEPTGLRALVSAPAAVEVGVPFELTVELDHADAVRPRLLADAVGESWVVLADRGSATLPGAEGRATTLVRWTVCALEPQERALPQLMATFPDGSFEAPFVEPGGIDVGGVLQPGEDEARPPHGFRDAPPAVDGRPWWAFGLAAAALVAAALLALRRRRRRAARPAPAPTPLQRLEAIDPRELSGPDAVQAAYYELTSLVRAALDLRQGRDRSGCTDEEWLRALDGSEGVSEEERDALEDLLRSSALVKYGGSRPTHWAVQETLERARELLAGSPVERGEVAP